jgi:hypothetical protein
MAFGITLSEKSASSATSADSNSIESLPLFNPSLSLELQFDKKFYLYEYFLVPIDS